MDFNEDDVMYEDIGSGDSGYSNTDANSNIIQQIFRSAAQVGTSYFNSQTPQNVAVSPYGNINPSTGRPYAYSVGSPSSSSPLVWLALLGAVGFVAWKALVK